jgi:glycosyltransferase involved in cell wall biosynthesis
MVADGSLDAPGREPFPILPPALFAANVQRAAPERWNVKTLVVSHAAATFTESKGGADVLALRHARFLQRAFGPVGYVGILNPGEIDGLTYFAVRDTDLLSYDRMGPRMAAIGYLLNHFFRAAKAAFVAHRNCRDFAPDLVITHTSTATVILKTLRPRTPLAYQIHDGLFAHRTVKGAMERLVRFLMNDLLEMAAVRRAQQILCVSSSIELQLRNAGVPAEKLSVLPFVHGDSSLDEVKRSVVQPSPPPKLPTTEPFILSVGQQSGRKRFDLLIEAMPLVKSPVHLVLAGDGPLHAHYRALVTRLGLADRVHLEQRVSDATLANLYAHATCYMLVSENEGFPMTFAEAIAYGCPSLLMCPNIESTAEYPGGLARLIRQIPAPSAIAELMDEAFASALPTAGERAAETVRRAPVEGAEDVSVELKSIYIRIFARLSISDDSGRALSPAA